MEPQIVHPSPRYAPAALLEPSTSGYLHFAAEVNPPQRPGPLLYRGREKRELLARLGELARRLEREAAVEKATVLEAVAIPPLSRFPYVREHAGEIRLPRFDVALLVETTSTAVIPEVQATPPCREILEALRSHSRHVHAVAARNAKRMGDVDESRQGLFLFNYFVADDADRALRLWDHLARWYEVETGLDNSILLVPLEGERSDYLAINHARWDQSVPRFLSRQFLKRSFWTFVQANLATNRVGAMPVLYRLARPERRAVLPGVPVALAAGAILGAFAALALARGRRRKT